MVTVLMYSPLFSTTLRGTALPTSDGDGAGDTTTVASPPFFLTVQVTWMATTVVSPQTASSSTRTESPFVAVPSTHVVNFS